MRRLYAFSIVAIFMLTTLAWAESVKIKGMPVKIGDTVEDVQKALNTKLEPEKSISNMPSSPFDANKKKTELHLKTKGIWIFFEKGKVYTVRMDKPFSGSIGGVKIGDPSDKIEKTLGPAVNKGKFGFYDTFTYYFDDQTTTRFDVNQDDEIQSILFMK